MNALFGPLLVVVGVLLVAGVAKVRSPSPTASALEGLRVPKPLLAARALGMGEVVVAIAAIVFGSSLLFALVALAYGAFTAFIIWALAGKADISCGCFGHEDTPPTIGHAAFNAAAAAVAAIGALDPVSIFDFDGTFAEGALTAVLTVLAITLSIAVLTSVPRNLALVRGTAPARVPEFSLNAPSKITTRGTP